MSPACTVIVRSGCERGRAREVRAEPGGAAQILLGRLEVAVEVVHAKELELDAAVARRRRRRFGAGAKAQKRHQDGAGKRGRGRKQVTAVGQSRHGGSWGASRFRLRPGGRPAGTYSSPEKLGRRGARFVTA